MADVIEVISLERQGPGLRSQYHCCWWSGDARGQGISNNGVSWVVSTLKPLALHQWFRKWLVTYPATSHYLNQCWNSVNWTLGNKLQWNLNQNVYIFIQENAFEKFFWKWRPLCLCLNVLTLHFIVSLQAQQRTYWGFALPDPCLICTEDQ